MSHPYIHREAPEIPAPLLIYDALHRTYVRPPLLLCGPGNPELGKRIRDELATLITKRNDVQPGMKDLLIADMYNEPVNRFPDSHVNVRVIPSCDGRRVFIFQNAYPEPDSRLMEVFLMADAARRAGADDITVMLPYYPYGRGDRKAGPREAIPASLVAELLATSGANRIITNDIHAEQTTGSIRQPWDNLYASTLFIPELKGMVKAENTVVMGADVGTMKRISAYKKRLGAVGIAFVVKNRDLNESSSNPEALMFIGDVEGREVVIVDDESVSFSTILNAANEAVHNGAVKVIVVLSHLKYAEQNAEHEKMLRKIKEMPPEFVALLTTDSVALPPEITDLPVVKVVDTAPFWAEIIWRTNFGVSLSPDLIN